MIQNAITTQIIAARQRSTWRAFSQRKLSHTAKRSQYRQGSTLQRNGLTAQFQKFAPCAILPGSFLRFVMVTTPMLSNDSAVLAKFAFTVDRQGKFMQAHNALYTSHAHQAVQVEVLVASLSGGGQGS